MKAWEQYFKLMEEVVKKVKDTQEDNLLAAADILTECTKAGGIIHAFGAGHSYLITLDIFWRAATLANVHTIFEPGIAGANEVTKSSYVEKLPGYGEILIEYHKIAPPDAMIIVSNSGNNAVPIEMSIACKKRGVKVIAITNCAYSDYLNPIHSSGKKLKDFADVVLDNCSMIGDAAVKIEGFNMLVGSTSTIPGVFLQTALLTQTVENLVEQGYHPDVYYNGHLSANSEDVKHHNNELIDKYYYKIRNL